MLKKERAKTGRLMLWKVICKDNKTGLWSETYNDRKFHVGNNRAAGFGWPRFEKGQFHCFFTRDLARRYKRFRLQRGSDKNFKIIKVCANRTCIVRVGHDREFQNRSVSVSRMEIKSLKHQR